MNFASLPAAVRPDAIASEPWEKQTVLVIANGPSARLLDFSLLQRLPVATLGMNAAYRFWDRVGFRPDFYLCLDSVVIRSHAKGIADLVREGRISKFFLREEILEDEPGLRGHPDILWFGEVRQEGGIFATEFVTTGSWALRWMVFLGYRNIAAIGIDTNYVERIPQAKAARGGDVAQLEIKETPGFNPNYFFGDYQQQGDRYHVPNDSAYWQATGRLVHVDALAEAVRDASRLGFTSRFVDLSPVSSHGIFPKISWRDFLRRLRFAGITSFLAEGNPEKLRSLAEIAVHNADNPFLWKWIIFLEGERDKFFQIVGDELAGQLEERTRAGKLVWETVTGRPSYLDFFRRLNAESGESAQGLVTNADLVFGPLAGQSLVERNFEESAPDACITRWNATPNGFFLQSMKPNPPWDELPAFRFPTSERNFFSFDSYAVGLPFTDLVELGSIPVGTLGCDTALAAILRAKARPVLNPCFTIRAIHYDDQTRDYGTAAAHGQTAANVAVFRDLVLANAAGSPLLLESLEKLSVLEPEVAWLGDPGNDNPWGALFSAIGGCAWSGVQPPPPLHFETCPISFAELMRGEVDLAVIEEIRSAGDVFVEWELTGFPERQGLLECFLQAGRSKERLDFLANYPWQSVVRVDSASDEQRRVLADVSLIAKQMLGLRAVGVPASRPVLGDVVLSSGLLRMADGILLPRVPKGLEVLWNFEADLKPFDRLRCDLRFSTDSKIHASLFFRVGEQDPVFADRRLLESGFHVLSLESTAAEKWSKWSVGLVLEGANALVSPRELVLVQQDLPTRFFTPRILQPEPAGLLACDASLAAVGATAEVLRELTEFWLLDFPIPGTDPDSGLRFQRLATPLMEWGFPATLLTSRNFSPKADATGFQILPCFSESENNQPTDSLFSVWLEELGRELKERNPENKPLVLCFPTLSGSALPAVADFLRNLPHLSACISLDEPRLLSDPARESVKELRGLDRVRLFAASPRISELFGEAGLQGVRALPCPPPCFSTRQIIRHLLEFPPPSRITARKKGPILLFDGDSDRRDQMQELALRISQMFDVPVFLRTTELLPSNCHRFVLPLPERRNSRAYADCLGSLGAAIRLGSSPQDPDPLISECRLFAVPVLELQHDAPDQLLEKISAWVGGGERPGSSLADRVEFLASESWEALALEFLPARFVCFDRAQKAMWKTSKQAWLDRLLSMMDLQTADEILRARKYAEAFALFAPRLPFPNAGFARQCAWFALRNLLAERNGD